MLSRYLMILVSIVGVTAISLVWEAQKVEVTQSPQHFFGILEFEKTDIVASQAGIVKEITVPQGEKLKRSQEIISLENFQAELELKQAEEGLKVAKQGLNQLRSLNSHKALEENQEKFKLLEDRLSQIQADLETKGNLLDQVVKLNAIGLVSDQKVRELRNTHQETLDELEKLMGEVKDTSWSLDRISKNTAWDREIELLAKINELETIKALAQRKIRHASILAPEEGELVSLEVKEGDFVGIGKIIGTVRGSNKLLLKVFVPEDKIHAITEKGLITIIDSEYLPVGNGTIEQIGQRQELDPRDRLSEPNGKNGVHLLTIRLSGLEGDIEPGTRLGILLEEVSHGLGY